MSTPDLIFPASTPSESRPPSADPAADPAAAQIFQPFDGKYVLCLYVTGNTANSVKAIANIKRLCDEYLADRYEMEVIDIYTHPAQASEDQIIAVPTLVRLKPGPVTRLIGDMSNSAKVMSGLGLPGMHS